MSTQTPTAAGIGSLRLAPYTTAEATRDGVWWLPTIARGGIGTIVLDTVDRRRTVESAERAALGLDLLELAAALARAVLG